MVVIKPGYDLDPLPGKYSIRDACRVAGACRILSPVWRRPWSLTLLIATKLSMLILFLGIRLDKVSLLLLGGLRMRYLRLKYHKLADVRGKRVIIVDAVQAGEALARDSLGLSVRNEGNRGGLRAKGQGISHRA